MSDFGVIICTCKFDFFLAKGCVASVRHALGDVPITLFIDDDLEVGAFAQHYRLNVMYRREVRDPWLREVNTGWGLPKMTMLWESPYERFLYLDCDTIIWGDVAKAHLEPFDADLIIDPGDMTSRPWLSDAGSDERISREYFNPRLMEKVFPDFPWKKYRSHYFCTGVFAARRNCLPLPAYQRLIETRAAHPGLFPIGEMPLLNFLIFDAEERGDLKIKRMPMQTVCEWENQAYLKSTFSTPPPSAGTCAGATVFHFTDPKPLAASSGFNHPMQHFRVQCAREYSQIPRVLAGSYTRLEELPWRLRIAYRRNFGALHLKCRDFLRQCPRPSNFISKIRDSLSFRAKRLFAQAVIRTYRSRIVSANGNLPSTKKTLSNLQLIFLTGREQLPMLQLSLRSIACNWDEIPRILLVSDGSISEEELPPLFSWWPNKVTARPWRYFAESAMARGRKDLAALAEQNMLGRKLCAIVESAIESAILFADTDILWFKGPPPLPAKSDRAALKLAHDISPMYDENLLATFPDASLRQSPWLNTGVCFARGDVLDEARLNEIVKAAAEKPHYFSEQTILALTCTRLGGESWPLSDIFLGIDDEIRRPAASYTGRSWIARHYPGRVRHWFWVDAYFLSKTQRRPALAS